MKFKRILMLFLSAAALQVTAQSGLYLKPSAGVGFGKLQGRPENTLHSNSRAADLNSFITTAGAGYKFKNWCIESGIGYARFSYVGPPLSGLAAPFQPIHKQVVIPFRIGYQIRVNRRLHLQPALGGSAYLNRRFRSNGFPAYHGPARESKVHSSSTSVTMGAEGQISATYKVHANMELFGGPALHYMLGPNVEKDQPILFVQPPYSLMMNCGINWYIPRPRQMMSKTSEN